MDEYTNYLVHHGIKGQRWGIRRFQNADGSLTSAGRNKYGVGPKRDKKQSRAEKKAAKKRAKAALERAKQIQKEKAARDRRMKTGSGAASEAVKMKEKDIKALTEQYRNANEYMKERSKLDEYIDKYSPKEPTKAEKLVGAFDKASKIASSASTIYDAYKKIFGKPETVKDLKYWNAQEKRLSVIAKKKELGIDDADVREFAKTVKPSIDKKLKDNNKKIKDLNKSKNKDKKDMSNAEKTSEIIQYIFNTNNYNNTLNGNVLKGDVYKNEDEWKRLNK